LVKIALELALELAVKLLEEPKALGIRDVLTLSHDGPSLLGGAGLLLATSSPPAPGREGRVDGFHVLRL
jgi:hypothetical protein